MEKLLTEEFFHYGTDKIFIEQWLNIQMEQKFKDYIKPYGGLWSSHKNEYTISDWIGYKQEDPSFYDVAFLSRASSLIKFKENAKILKIENKNDYKNLKDSGFITTLKHPITIDKWYYKKIITELLNYEKISDLYDLLYVSDISNENLSNYSVRTMLIMNPNSIEYYTPIEADYLENKIIKIGEKQTIKKPDKSFYDIIDYIKSLYITPTANTYEEFIEKLSEITKQLISFLSQNKDKYNILLPNNIDKLKVLETIVRNLYREKYREAQKKLLKIN